MRGHSARTRKQQSWALLVGYYARLSRVLGSISRDIPLQLKYGFIMVLKNIHVHVAVFSIKLTFVCFFFF